MSEKIVGHKTFRDGDGFRHEPLLESEAAAILAAVEKEDQRRKELMPDEQSAIRMMFAANQRLRDFGWNDAVYCPKDGTMFQALEFGSTGIHTCRYEGEWPKGHWEVIGDDDIYPSRPVMFRRFGA